MLQTRRAPSPCVYCACTCVNTLFCERAPPFRISHEGEGAIFLGRVIAPCFTILLMNTGTTPKLPPELAIAIVTVAMAIAVLSRAALAAVEGGLSADAAPSTATQYPQGSLHDSVDILCPKTFCNKGADVDITFKLLSWS